MKALQITAPGEVRLIDLPKPEPQAGEVRVRVRRGGYCGSDLSTFRGVNPLVSYPRVPGHELAGLVDAIGAATSNAPAVGTPVLIVPYTACGKCSACRQQRPNCCRYNQTLGVQRGGGLAEFICVPVEKLLTAPGLDFAELAMVEPLTIGFHAVARGRVATGDVVAVLGCGAIGLGAIAGASVRGARVIAVDLDAAKLALAREAGATETINTATENLHERLQALTDGHGPEVVIEAIGLPQTFRAAVEEVGFAGRVVYIGYAKAPVEYETKLFVQKELDVLGSRNATREDFAAVIAHLQARRFPVAKAITRAATLADAPAAMRDWAANPAAFTKIQVEFP